MTDHEIIAAQLVHQNAVESENQELRQRIREYKVDRKFIIGKLRAVEEDRDRLLVILGRSTAARRREV